MGEDAVSLERDRRVAAFLNRGLPVDAAYILADAAAQGVGPSGLQQLAADNARTWNMSDEDRQRWFAEHPASMFED